MLFYIYKISYLENNSNTFRYPFKSTFTYSFMNEHVNMLMINVLITFLFVSVIVSLLYRN